MLRLLLFHCFLLMSVCSLAGNIKVKDLHELKAANKNARPGDIIILQNGEWNDVKIELNCSGTKENPISFKAETAGKVLITGNSSLELGGNFIVVDGWYFNRGYAGKNAVINFRIDKDQLANNCRVTNTVINDFNNPKRMDENYWISFSGKNNRIDHCSFLNKKNMGVLLAVLLDDERSRENFHSIDHNYFGVRLPLASNSGEIIRVGVSQHCEFNSNTRITDNFFEHCDGETEIVSIKSGSNVVRNNLFKECQGGVVLRHGNYNTVENNIFLGNNKAGTGGVRIINKGQWVVNNLFYQCRGTSFRSPLSLMNGVPNSPANRYVEVSDAVVMNNTFIDCTPISFCEGSDTERSVTPHEVIFRKNIFYNELDPKIYNAFDDISGIFFFDNYVNQSVSQDLGRGFDKSISLVRLPTAPFAYVAKTAIDITGQNDSLSVIAAKRLSGKLSTRPGYRDDKRYAAVLLNAKTSTGSKWFSNKKLVLPKSIMVNCPDAATLIAQLSKASENPIILQLTGKDYPFSQPLLIRGDVTITSMNKEIFIGSSETLPALIELKGNGRLVFNNFNVNLESLKAGTFISSDLTGTSNHSNFNVINSKIKNSAGSFFTAAKSTMIDSIKVLNSSFENITGTIFDFSNENDKKGYYNVEKIRFSNNNFANNRGQLLTMLRGGNDESTMGPLLVFAGNKITNCSASQPLIQLYGTQVSFITGNKFTGSAKDAILIQYEDAVRAAHSLADNKIISSGKIITNKFVEEKNNITP
ncbi:chondroitinase-B domain-containing protein [Ferruginibacter sp. HRS2-29]|uniref:chondroitinase-B domain-containing protein n=1 Tax=Ferruginibacter sp. HRS2-29 TaxID=2487334 RepID=UPI0020CDA01F|nr:chondroitinase-B domain-containing protein [Ferruginibacter sp. HRS2-29]MCP9749463.1 hypothetical protein [Ferruginibacter sp. HRS2-29]